MVIRRTALVRFCVQNEEGRGVLQLLSILPSKKVSDDLNLAQERTIDNFRKNFESETFARYTQQLEKMKTDLNLILSLYDTVDVMSKSTKENLVKILSIMPAEWFYVEEVDNFCRKFEPESERMGKFIRDINFGVFGEPIFSQPRKRTRFERRPYDENLEIFENSNEILEKFNALEQIITQKQLISDDEKFNAKFDEITNDHFVANKNSGSKFLMGLKRFDLVPRYILIVRVPNYHNST